MWKPALHSFGCQVPVGSWSSWVLLHSTSFSWKHTLPFTGYNARMTWLPAGKRAWMAESESVTHRMGCHTAQVPACPALECTPLREITASTQRDHLHRRMTHAELYQLRIGGEGQGEEYFLLKLNTHFPRVRTYPNLLQNIRVN